MTAEISTRPKVQMRPQSWRNTTLATGIGAASIASILVGRSVEAGPVMAIPLLAFLAVASRLCPEMVALTLVYGWVLLTQISVIGVQPLITIASAWGLVCLLFLHPEGRPLRSIQNPCSLLSVSYLAGFLLLGLTPVVFTVDRSFGLDILRGWLGFFAAGVLACRVVVDVERIMKLIPLGFLLYPAALTAGSWSDFSSNLHSQAVLGAGLQAETLNTNLLGSAAALAALVALADSFHCRRFAARWSYILLFCFATTIGVLSGARQFIVSWLVGMVVLGFMRNWRRGLIFTVLIASVVLAGHHAAVSVLPEQSGLKARILELGAPIDTWKTGSATMRLDDFALAVDQWKKSPLIGVGFLRRFSHNIFLDFLASTGVVGLLCFLLFCGGIVRGYFQAVKRTGDRRALLRARETVLPMLAALFVQENISGGTWGMDLGVLIVLLGAMLSATGNLRRAQTSYHGGPVPGSASALAVAGASGRSFYQGSFRGST